MKNFIKSSIMIILLMMGSTAWAQKNRLSYSQSVIIKPTSTTKTYEVEVDGDVKRLTLSVNCELFSGQITVEIFAPDGSKQGKFKAGAPGETYATKVDGERKGDPEYGRLEKYVDNPENGVWIIKITPIKSNAQINIRSSQYYAN